MKRILFLMLFAGACARTTPEMLLVSDSADALGGKKIQEVNTIVMEGAGKSVFLGQNKTPGGEPIFYQMTGFKRTIDLTNWRGRQEAILMPTFSPAAVSPVQKQIVGLDGDVAFNIGSDGHATRQSDMVAKDRRAEFLLHNPVGIIRLALDPSARLSNLRKVDKMDMVDIDTARGEHMTLAVDSRTHLPATVTSKAYNINLGDVVIETSFLDYQDVDGLKLPMRLVSTMDTHPNIDIDLSRNTVNTAVPNMTASDAVKATAPPTPSATVTAEEIATGIWFLAGQSHHSALVEFSEHTELIEVPESDTRTLAVIAKARELVPNKPLTRAIVTHHHFDHSGGIRAAISEGLGIVAHEINEPFFKELAHRKHSIVQDALAKNPKPVKIETVGEEMVVKDAGRTMEIYHVDGSPHSDGMLMIYFPKEMLLVQADLYLPDLDVNPSSESAPRQPIEWILNLNENIEHRKLKIDRYVPLHVGATIKTHIEFKKRVMQSLKMQAAK